MNRRPTLDPTLSPLVKRPMSSPSAPSTPLATGGKKRLSLSTGLAASGTGAKKLLLKAKPRTSDVGAGTSDYATTSIPILARAVRAILAVPSVPTPESLEALYALCDTVVRSGRTGSQTLYDQVKMELERAAGAVRTRLTAEGDGEGWLAEVGREWNGFEVRLRLVGDVVLLLDRTFVLTSPALLGIREMGLDIFRHSVVEDDVVKARLTKSFIDLINAERDGTSIPRALVKSLVQKLLLLAPSAHSEIFARPFLAASVPYFASSALNAFTALSSSDFLALIASRLSSEEERCHSLLGSQLVDDVQKVVLDQMVEPYLDAIVEKDFPAFMQEEKETELKLLFELLGKIGELASLRTAFREYVKTTGLGIVTPPEGDDKMVVNLIAFREKVVRIVEGCFAKEEGFVTNLNGAFEFFINKRENKPAELMAKYLDAKLRSGNRGMEDEVLEKTLQDVLALFRFTQGKDIFEAFYKRDLAKRLLLNKSASFDAERSMLLKLKDECGPGFTAKLEIMFKDIDISSDVMRAFSLRSSLPSTVASPMDLYVNILSMGNWPTYPPVNPRLPEKMVENLERFKQFYITKYSGRTLVWQHSLDHCTLKAVFPKGGKKELAVSLFQTLVLLLFNGLPAGGKLSFADIVESTRLDKTEARRTLQSLACGKVRVLVKFPKGREVADTDEFAFNQDFKDDHVKIKINQIQQKETAEENKSTTDRVFTDRSSHLQLAIVRIMKARKTLKYTELVMETVSQIGHRFKVETAEIKKSIGSLIEREYLRRSEENQNVFEYLA